MKEAQWFLAMGASTRAALEACDGRNMADADSPAGRQRAGEVLQTIRGLHELGAILSQYRPTSSSGKLALIAHWNRGRLLSLVDRIIRQRDAAEKGRRA